MSGRSSWLSDLSLSAVVAGFVTVLVGFTSSAVIIFQAAQALGATPAQSASWMWALGLGMGSTCIVLSLVYRMPVVTAWSTPGAAMLITGAAGVTLEHATGAFLICAALIALSGFSGWFERALRRIPVSLASAMLAGVLLRFGMDVFVAMHSQLQLVLAMFVSYLLMRRFRPRYAIPATLLVGIVLSWVLGLLQVGQLSFTLAQPVWVTPQFSVSALLGVALPLFIVTMASQNVTGLAVVKAAGYDMPVSSVIGWIGVVNFLLAPFGAFALNLAAITAAICVGREAHEEPSRRYIAAVFAGIFYCLVGLFGATVAMLFSAFPKQLVLAVAGLALLGTIGNGLATALAGESDREPALITFLLTASGVSLFGIGSAFWGLVAGIVGMLILNKPASTNAQKLAPNPSEQDSDSARATDATARLELRDTNRLTDHQRT